MSSIEESLRKLNLTLPEPPAPAGLYSPFTRDGRTVYASGFIPVTAEAAPRGKLGKDLTVTEGQEAAKLCLLNMLSAFRRDFGSLDRVKRILKLVVFVQSADDFYQQPQVANGASELALALFGAPAPARSAVGASALPLNVPVEVEAVIELAE